jgi:hypothetical protein
MGINGYEPAIRFTPCTKCDGVSFSRSRTTDPDSGKVFDVRRCTTCDMRWRRRYRANSYPAAIASSARSCWRAWLAFYAVVHAESCYGNLSWLYYPACMDKREIADRLRNADYLIAEQQTEIDRFKVEMAGLESAGRPTSELRHALEQMEAALALYIQHREKLAKSLRG